MIGVAHGPLVCCLLQFDYSAPPLMMLTRWRLFVSFGRGGRLSTQEFFTHLDTSPLPMTCDTHTYCRAVGSGAVTVPVLTTSN